MESRCRHRRVDAVERGLRAIHQHRLLRAAGDLVGHDPIGGRSGELATVVALPGGEHLMAGGVEAARAAGDRRIGADRDLEAGDQRHDVGDAQVAERHQGAREVACQRACRRGRDLVVAVGADRRAAEQERVALGRGRRLRGLGREILEKRQRHREATEPARSGAVPRERQIDAIARVIASLVADGSGMLPTSRSSR